MHPPKYDLLRRKIVELVRANGGELANESGTRGGLSAEVALALNVDKKPVHDCLYKLRQRGVLLGGERGTGVRLADNWRDLMRPEEMEAEEVGARAVFSDLEDDEDDLVEQGRRREEDDALDDLIEEASSSLKTWEGQLKKGTALEDEEDEPEDEEIAMGRAIIRAAADALTKVDEAERVARRFASIVEENEDLRRQLEAKVDTSYAESLEDRIRQLEADNKRLSGELKKRHGNSVRERLSPGERQAMTKLMKDLSRRP